MKTKHYLTLSDAEFLLNHAHQYAIKINSMSALPSWMKLEIC